jgi:hypothetical protein
MNEKLRRFQFGLGNLLILVLLAAVACWLIQFGPVVRLFSFVLCSSVAGIVFAPETVRGATIGGGVGASIGVWIAVLASVFLDPRPEVFKWGISFPTAMVLRSVCNAVPGFVLGAGIGAAVGVLRQSRHDDKQADQLIKRLRA